MRSVWLSEEEEKKEKIKLTALKVFEVFDWGAMVTR